MEYALSLGSNLGDRLAGLKTAKESILHRLSVSSCDQSPVYETAPVEVQEQYRHLAYLNAVIIINAVEQPETVSDIIHAVEADMGRVRTEDRFAPRPIDIDILYAGKTMSDDDNLTLPHPRWAERRFVVQPLADINPGLIFPGDHKTVAEILKSLPNESDVTMCTENW